MTLLPNTYYDFTCQDLPPALEDGHAEIIVTEQGWFVGLLNWDAIELAQKDEEGKAGVVSICKTRVLEIIEVCSRSSLFWLCSVLDPFYLSALFPRSLNPPHPDFDITSLVNFALHLPSIINQPEKRL